MNPKLLYYLILASSIQAAEIATNTPPSSTTLHIVPNGQIPSGNDKVHSVELTPGEHVLISMGPGNGNNGNTNTSGSLISKNALKLPEDDEKTKGEITVVPQSITPAGDLINLSPEQERIQKLIDQQPRPSAADLNDKIKKYFEFTKLLRESNLKTRIKLPRLVFIGNEDEEKYRVIENIIGMKGSLTPKPPTTDPATVKLKTPKFKAPIKFKLIKDYKKTIKVDGKEITEGTSLYDALKSIVNSDEDKDFVLIETPVEVEITGPELQSLAFVDLPWKVPEYANKSCNDPILSRLLRKYLHDPWNLTVAVGKSALPFTDWDTLKLARTYDENLKHLFTVGVEPSIEADALGIVLGLQKAYPALTKDEMYYFTDEVKEDTNTNANTHTSATTSSNSTSTSSNSTASNTTTSSNSTVTNTSTASTNPSTTPNTTTNSSTVTDTKPATITYKVCEASTCGLSNLTTGLQSKLIQIWSALRPDAQAAIQCELDKLSQRLKGYDGYTALPSEKEKFSALMDQVTPILNDRLVFAAEDREAVGCIESGPLDLIKGSIFDSPTTPVQPKRIYWSEIFSTYQREIGQLQKMPTSIDTTAVKYLIEELKSNGPTRKIIYELKKLVLNVQLETLKTPKMNLLTTIKENWKDSIHFGLEARDALEAFPDFKKALKDTAAKILDQQSKSLTTINEQIESADYTSGWTFDFYDDPKASIWVDLMKTASLEDAVSLFNKKAEVGFTEICRTHAEIQPRLVIDGLLEKRIVVQIIEEFKKAAASGIENTADKPVDTPVDKPATESPKEAVNTTTDNTTTNTTVNTVAASTEATVTKKLTMTELIDMSKEAKEQLTKLKGNVSKIENLVKLTKD